MFYFKVNVRGKWKGDRWLFMPRSQCPIHNGTLKGVVWFCAFKLFIFICGFSAKVICAFLAYKKQWRNYHNKTFFESRIDDIFHIFIRRFQGYRCKSGITILAWSVTWFYAYSPFKSIFHVFSVVVKQIVLTVAWKLIERSPCTRHYCCVYVHWTLYMYILALYSTCC